MTDHPISHAIRRALAASVTAAVAMAGAALADSPVGDPNGVGPSDEILLDEPPVLGMINDGDESLADTVFVYLDGCPLLSVTPPASGRGQPTVTMVEAAGDCAPAAGVAGPRGNRVGLASGADKGFHVQLWRDDAGPVKVAADSGVTPGGGSALIVELSNLYPAEPSPSTPIFAGQPVFWIPGVFGDPSGNLVPVSASNPGTGGPNVLFGPGGGAGGGPFAVAGNPVGSGGGNGGGPGGTPGTGFFGGPPTGGDTIIPGGGNGILPPVSAVPLPATLVLLLGALFVLRGYVRRT